MTETARPSPAPPVAPSTPSPLVEHRVSTVAGHRLCSACGFTLLGQPILREPHYAMLIIRCPECGGVAAVQEYPALGKWAARWAALLAAMWLITLIAATFASAGILFGMSEGMLEVGSAAYAEEIATAHDLWYKALKDPTTSAVTPASQNVAPNAYSTIDSAWWDQLDKTEFLRARGGGFEAIGPAALWFAGWVVLAGLVTGVFWSVALIAQHRTRAMLITVVIVLLAGAFSWMTNHAQGNSWPWMNGTMYAAWAAREQLAPYTAAMALSIGALAVSVGIWFGRPVVRLAVRTLLPPTLRLPLAGLWLADGLSPPPIRPRGR